MKGARCLRRVRPDTAGVRGGAPLELHRHRGAAGQGHVLGGLSLLCGAALAPVSCYFWSFRCAFRTAVEAVARVIVCDSLTILVNTTQVYTIGLPLCSSRPDVGVGQVERAHDPLAIHRTFFCVHWVHIIYFQIGRWKLQQLFMPSFTTYYKYSCDTFRCKKSVKSG